MQLKDVRNLLAPNCDLTYLRMWAEELTVKEALEAFVSFDK